MSKNYFFLIILILFNFEVSSNEKKVFIKKQVNEHIITNVDIDNEVNFITVLNPKLVNIDKKEINKYAEDNLINEMSQWGSHCFNKSDANIKAPFKTIKKTRSDDEKSSDISSDNRLTSFSISVAEIKGTKVLSYILI